ncbi:unnamed protein product, partial [marine sediment metagenome]
IARACSVSKDTVRDYLCRASEAGLSWPLPEGLSEEDLERQLYPVEIDLGGKRTLPDWSEIHQDLRKKGVHVCFYGKNTQRANLTPTAIPSFANSTIVGLRNWIL